MYGIHHLVDAFSFTLLLFTNSTFCDIIILARCLIDKLEFVNRVATASCLSTLVTYGTI